MRKLALFAGAFSAAVLLWRYSLWPLALAAALLCCLGGLILGRKGRTHLRSSGIIILAATVLALVWSHSYYRHTLQPWEVYHRERELYFTARVDSFGYINKTGSRVVDARLTDPVSGDSIDGRLYLDSDMEISPGDLLEVIGSFYVADWVGSGETTTFSSRGTFARFYADEVLSHTPGGELSLLHRPLYVSRRVDEQLTRFFAQDAAPLARALVTGNQDGLDEHFLAMSRRSGLAHVIVVSGMHISFLAGVMAFFLGRRNRLSIFFTLLILCFFALMAGGTPSVWRAVVLCASGLIAPLFGRENDPPTSLLAALMLLLLVNPYAIASVGLQLSFASVAGIYFLAPVLLNRWKPTGKRPSSSSKRALRLAQYTLVSALSVSLGAIAFTTPLCGRYFSAVSLIGPVSNLLALPAVSAAFLLSVAVSVIGSVFPPVAVGLAWVGNWLLRYITALTVFLGELPFASFTLTSIYYLAGLVGIYVVICLYLFSPERKKRLIIPMACCFLLASCCVWFTRSEFRAGDMTVAVLDVGQGQAVVLRSGGRTILVDCGGDNYTDAGHIVADYLADVGITKLDLLVLTHYHADHANGVPSLLRRMEVESAVLPDVEDDEGLRSLVTAGLERSGTEVTLLTENIRYELDFNTTLNLYAPLGRGSTNEQGLSVLLSSGSYDTLITGDMNSEVENRLVKYGNLPDIELLVVGHHGSRYSTGDTLLDTLRPETAVISVGAGNTYGHPNQETLTRLHDRNITIYRTDLSGTAVFHTTTKE